MGSRQARPGPPGSAASEPWDRANSRRPLGLGVPIQRVGVTLAPAPHPGMNNDPTPGLAAASVTVRTPARALSSGARRAPGSGSRPAVPAGEEQVLGARGGGATGRAEAQPPPRRKPGLPPSPHRGSSRGPGSDRGLRGPVGERRPPRHPRPRWDCGRPAPPPGPRHREPRALGCTASPDVSAPGLYRAPGRPGPAGGRGAPGRRGWVLWGPHLRPCSCLRPRHLTSSLGSDVTSSVGSPTQLQTTQDAGLTPSSSPGLIIYFQTWDCPAIGNSVFTIPPHTHTRGADGSEEGVCLVLNCSPEPATQSCRTQGYSDGGHPEVA